MGIKGLTKIIEDIAPSAIQKNPGDLRGKKVAIDTSVILYQFLTKQPGEEVTNRIDTSYLLGMFERTKGIIDNGMFPVYVFDGNPPDLRVLLFPSIPFPFHFSFSKIKNCYFLPF